MLRMVKRFNEANPDVNVLMQRADWATLYNKLFVAGLGGRAPELFVVHTSALVRFAQAKFVAPIDDLVGGANGLDVNDIDANVWQGASVDGRHYALPLDVHLLGMYYNRRMFREAGVVDAKGEPRPPTNHDEFLDACARLTRRAPNGSNSGSPNVEQWGFVFTNLDSNLYTLMRQWDGPFFTPDESRCLLDDKRNVDALAFGVDLIRNRRVAPPPENFDSWVGFRQGKVGMAFEGIYMLADLEKQTDLEFGGAPIPQLGTNKMVWANSHNLCMRAGLNDAQRQATWRFMRFLSDNSLDWAAGGQVPVRKSLRATPRFASMPVQSAFATQIPIVNYLPRLPFIFEFQTEYDTAMESALRGSVSPQAALQTAASNINAIITRRQQALREGRGRA